MVDQTKNQKNQFAFILGREQEICLEELKSVLGRFDVCFDIYRITGNVVLAKLKNFSEKEAKDLINVLGGTVKIFQILDVLGNNITSQLANLISELKKEPQGKINFGISSFNPNLRGQQINSFALGAKKKLKGKMSLRYVESREGSELSTIVSLKNNLVNKGIEFGIFENEIGILVALNDPEEWGKRDYGKPRGDKFSGMLPPKLARMMVNLALGQVNSKFEARNSKQIINSNDQKYHPYTPPKLGGEGGGTVSDFGFSASNLKQSTVVIDCFCGSGNILLEGLMLGCDVIGSDVSEKAVEDSIKNIEWLTASYPHLLPLDKGESERGWNVFQADATDPGFLISLATSYKLPATNKSLAFVTEPYLGEPKKYKPSLNAAKGEYAKIKELYLNFLKNIRAVIPSVSSVIPAKVGDARGGAGIQDSLDPRVKPEDDKSVVLCLVSPLVETIEGDKFSLFRESVDEIKNLGYTQIRPSMIYGREYQVVKREIVLLQMKQEMTKSEYLMSNKIPNDLMSKLDI